MWIGGGTFTRSGNRQLDDIYVFLTLIIKVPNQVCDSWIIEKNTHSLQLIKNFPLSDSPIIRILFEKVEDMIYIFNMIKELSQKFDEALKKLFLQPNYFFIIIWSSKLFKSII